MLDARRASNIHSSFSVLAECRRARRASNIHSSFSTFAVAAKLNNLSECWTPVFCMWRARALVRMCDMCWTPGVGDRSNLGGEGRGRGRGRRMGGLQCRRYGRPQSKLLRLHACVCAIIVASVHARCRHVCAVRVCTHVTGTCERARCVQCECALMSGACARGAGQGS